MGLLRTIIIVALAGAAMFVMAMAGSTKVINWNPDMYKEHVNNFKRYSNAWGVPKDKQDLFRQTIGTVEVLSAALVPFSPIGHLLFGVVMIGACVTHYLVGEVFAFPAALLALNLVTYFIRRSRPASAPKKKSA